MAKSLENDDWTDTTRKRQLMRMRLVQGSAVILEAPAHRLSVLDSLWKALNSQQKYWGCERIEYVFNEDRCSILADLICPVDRGQWKLLDQEEEPCLKKKWNS